ncbi:MAG: restriction endonuclease [Chloroflexi bacterium]|nr:restriction endonuclease [Chloroflexota bacterium]
MAVPDFQSMMLPLLMFAGDGREHSIREAIEHLSEYFQLTDEDRREMLARGRQTRLENRVHWTRIYLSKACLLEPVGRARFRITARGQEVLQLNLPSIDIRFLMRYPEFVAFRERQPQQPLEPEEDNSEDEAQTQTPLEMLELSYQNLRQSLAEELLDTVKRCNPKFFETLVVDLLVAMGYGGSRKDAGQAIGRTGDGGIDGIIKEDRLGLDVIYLQAKRWEGAVGAPVVQTFAGSLDAYNARKGVMITTSKFTQAAHDFVNRIQKKIILIDGEQLAQLMIDYGIGVTEVNHYVVKRIDLDYFELEN